MCCCAKCITRYTVMLYCNETMKLLRHAYIKPGDRVLLRVDFNVDFDRKGRIVDEYRIRNVLPTIRALLSRKARVILLTHLGDPGPALAHRTGTSTQPIALYLSRALRLPVAFASRVIGGITELAVTNLKPGGVLLLENVRWEPGEVVNDPGLARKIARLGDIYIFDAFGVAHRNHASCAILPQLLPSYVGLSLEQELRVLARVAQHPKHPLVFVLGGAKISTKLPILRSFIKTADKILLGGALANTLLQRRGFSIGASLIEKLSSGIESKMISLAHPALLLPIDVLTASSTKSKKFSLRAVGSVPKGEMILDVGPDTLALFSRIIRSARMIFWNGPMGFIENSIFAQGTESLAQVITRSRAFSVVGGGDTLVVLDRMKLLGKFDFVSSGGGAMLAFLAGERLPALEALGYYT